MNEPWAALPERIQKNDAIMQRLQSASSKLAAATYQDYFWVENLNDRGLIRSIPESELLPRMISLSLHQGGNDPQREANFWKGVWAK